MKKKLNVFLSLLLVVQMILSLAVMPAYAEGEDETPKYSQAESPAVVYNLNVDWKYKRAVDGATFPLASALAGVVDANGKQFYEVGYDDSDWETVSVPHAVNAADSFDGLGLDAGEASVYRGFMFYRKNITVPETDAGKKFIIEFEAFRQSVYVYVNGEMAGYYEAGVAPVGFDLTDYIVAGQENVIAVATDNAASRGNDNPTIETIPGTEPGSRTGYGYQWNTKDFNEVQGGLTGNIKLYAKNKIYQTLPLYSNMKTMGNYIYASNFDLRENSADITVEAEVRNETDANTDITLQVDVVDMDGNLVATFESDATQVAAATDTDADQFLTVVPETAYDADGVGLENNNVDLSTVDVTKVTATANVTDLKFWSDVSPNLYTVYTYLKADDTVIDAQSTVTGFREVIYDKDKGLQINGETTYLKGYAQRSTNEWAAIGVANDWLSDIDMQLVKESNANMIRWMHVAPNPVDVRAGDKYGVVSIAPAGDKEKDVTGRQWDQRVETMRDVIIYFRNSPSVIFWEAGNDKISNEHMKEMYDLKQILDPTGGRFMGSRSATGEPQPLDYAEWVGTIIHRQDTNMYGTMQSTGKYIPMIETEYHRNEAPRRVWDDYSPPYYDYVNKWLGANGSKTDGFDVWDQTQEDFSRSMFGSGDGYSYFWNNKVGGSGANMYSGASLMVWSDSNMHVRNCGVENARTSGRVDAARIKKESFYAIKAAQSTTPEIHILGHWNYPSYIEGDMENGNYWYEDKTWNEQWWVPNGTMLQRNPTNKTVYVIGSTGLSKVELYVNDVLVGTDTTPTDNFIYAFDGIDVTQSGKVYAKAYNEREEVVAEHEIKTAGEAATIRLTPVKGPDGLRADGSDYLYVDVEVIDAEGNVCPLDERKITFTVSDETKAKFIGGYNSGYYGDGLDGAGERIVNHKNYVFAENGINRVFVQSTREAGDFTLTATAEGMQPVTVSLSSVEFETEGGLTTVPQQSFKQGEIPDPPPQEKAVPLKSLGETFIADKNWGEEGSNVQYTSTDKKDYYTITVNGTEIEFSDKAYKPDSSTGVVSEVNPLLDAIKEAGADFTYTYTTTGEIPSYAYGEVPYITINSGENKIDVVKGSTNLFVNEETGSLMNTGVALNTAGTALTAEIIPVISTIDGVSIETDTENKVLKFTVESGSSTLSLMGDDTEGVILTVKNGKATVNSNGLLESAVLIEAAYEDGALKSVKTTPLSFVDSTEKSVDVAVGSKVMLWDSLEGMKPIAAAEKNSPDSPELAPTLEPEPTPEPTPEPIIDAVYEYDTVDVNNTCDTAMTNGVVSTDTSPDGTLYLTAEGGDICLPGLDANSKGDLMWEADVRFNNEGSSIIPRDNGDKKFGTCVIRNDGDGVPKLSIQTGGSSFTRYVEIDPTAWYKVVLIGRYSAPDAKTDMIVYKYEADGSLTKLGKWDNVNQRNLSANSNNGASHWNAGGGISVDNAKITTLGADTLYVSSDAEEITAGNTLGFDYEATRQTMPITKPEVTWEIYNADNTAPINDANITITAGGILNVGLEATAQTINIRATAASGIYASKSITVNAVDISNVKFDALTLSAEKSYVSANEPLTISVSATKNGEAVEVSNSDLIWYAADSTNMMKLGDDLKWIKIENGVVTVDSKAVTQDITIRAADPEDKVRGSIVVHVKAVDALEGEEDGALDKLLTADNCEAANVNANFTDSIDGTHAYQVTAAHKTGNISDTSNDVVIELDAKFTQEGVGWHITNNNNKVTCQVVYHNGNLCVQHGSSAYSTLTAVDSNKWYHIKAIRKVSSYFHVFVYEYDENGEREFVGLYVDQPQRNDSSMSSINVLSGLIYDNLRVLSPTPTDITIDTDVDTVFAGNTVQATSELTWNGAIMRNPDASIFEYRIYDAEDKYPLESDLITVDSTGLITIDPTVEAQDVYVRAVAVKSGKYASKKFSISSSDIYTINKLLIDEETENDIVGIEITKHFFYKLETTFITEIFDENGVLKYTSSKQLYGDAIPMGDSTVQLGIELPDNFDKEKDTIKVYPITRTTVDDPIVADGTLIATKSATSVGFTSVPTYDAGLDVMVLVLKADADETDVKAEDIIFFDVVDSLTTESVFSWTADAGTDYIVKTAGMIGGVHTVTAEGEAQEVTE